MERKQKPKKLELEKNNKRKWRSLNDKTKK